MLEIRAIKAGYGHAPVLHDLSLGVAEGSVTTLLGRNGMGKTTTIRAIMGLLTPGAGEIRFRNQVISGRKPEAIARLGLGLVPEGRQIFPTLTVHENLVATARPGAWTLPRIHTLFPRLAERAGQRGATLSGGEQQMLAIGRALMTNPHLLILDEATEGLAPLVRAEIWRVLAALKRDGLSILIVDKNLAALQRLADHHVIIEKGRTIWQGPAAELDADLAHRHLGV